MVPQSSWQWGGGVAWTEGRTTRHLTEEHIMRAHYLNALALGLAATVIFFAEEIQAQAFFDVTPAEIQVTRDAGSFIFSSKSLQDPTNVCEFELPFHILDVGRGYEFPSIGEFGVAIEGSLMVDREALLDTLGSSEAHFAQFCTRCGSNTGDFGAQALRAKIRHLEDDESATLHTVYFSEGISDNPERFCVFE
jgi:hypothetical protein